MAWAGRTLGRYKAVEVDTAGDGAGLNIFLRDTTPGKPKSELYDLGAKGLHALNAEIQAVVSAEAEKLDAYKSWKKIDKRHQELAKAAASVNSRKVELEQKREQIIASDHDDMAEQLLQIEQDLAACVGEAARLAVLIELTGPQLRSRWDRAQAEMVVIESRVIHETLQRAQGAEDAQVKELAAQVNLLNKLFIGAYVRKNLVGSRRAITGILGPPPPFSAPAQPEPDPPKVWGLQRNPNAPKPAQPPTGPLGIGYVDPPEAAGVQRAPVAAAK
jgi:hypothetical protein